MLSAGNRYKKTEHLKIGTLLMTTTPLLWPRLHVPSQKLCICLRS